MGELIVWVLDRSGWLKPCKTDTKSIAASPPELGAGKPKAPCEVVFPCSLRIERGSAELFAAALTDPRDPRSLRTESFRDLTPCDSEGGVRAADFAAQRRAARGGKKMPKPLCCFVLLWCERVFCRRGSAKLPKP